MNLAITIARWIGDRRNHLCREYIYWRARRRLEKLIAKAKASYEVESYRRHRAAALKGLRG